jgi:hypothetical protein
MVVFVGLWIEWEADEEEKMALRTPQQADLKDIEHKSITGWTVLMAGIVIEIACGCILAARGEWETWKSDPWTGNIADISADVYFEAAGTNGPNQHLAKDQRHVLYMALCDRSPGYPELGSSIVPLTASSFSFRASIPSSETLPPGFSWASTNESWFRDVCNG